MILLMYNGTILSSTSVVMAGRSIGAFDGPFVTLFPGSVHSPRLDDVHGRERGELYLRRRHRPSGLGTVPERTHPTPDPAQSGTGARRSLYGRHVCVVENGSIADALEILLNQPRHGAALGRAAMVAALFQQAHRAIHLARPRAKTMSPIIMTWTGGSIPSFSTPTGNIAAPILRRPTLRSTMPNSPKNVTSPPSC